MQIASISRIIAAPVGEVWGITSAFGAMRAWMPGIARCALEGVGVGAVRTAELPSGAVVRERLEVMDPERHRMRYLIVGGGASGATNMAGEIALEAVDGDRTRITWISEADEVPDLPQVRAYAQRAIAGNIEALARLLGAQVTEG